MTRRARWIRHWKLVAVFTAVLVVVVVGFGSSRVSALTSSERSADAQAAEGIDVPGTVDLFDTGVTHSLSVEYTAAAYRRMIATYRNETRKIYIPVTLTIDGTRMRQVGMRLKGNSTLRGLRTSNGQARGFGGGPGGAISEDAPERLPLLLSFDEFVDGRTYQGFETVAVRGGTVGGRAGETGLNEAVALKLVEKAGEPSERFSFGTLEVNGKATALRLLVEDPDTPFAENRFDHEGVLYKALSTGSFSYRGEDPLSYAEAFRQVTRTKRQDLGPLIDLLRWTQSSTDAQFAAGLAQRVDVGSFAAYVALQNILGNFDDMSGPGQNYYLWYDLDTKQFTPVTWDLNLALSGGGVGGFGGRFGGGPRNDAGPGADDAPGGQAPGGQAPGDQFGGFGGPRGGNLLKERFLATPRYAKLAAETEAKLRQELLGDFALDQLEQLQKVVAKSGTVSSETLASEVETLRATLAADGSAG